MCMIAEEPLFSVITVTFNAEDTVERTIRSVASQSYRNIEHIVIDGLSKDTTMQIVGKYANCIDVIVSEKDRGIYDAMNKGIKLAKGTYLCFMNAGDVFHNEDVLKEISLQIGGERPDVIYGETTIVDNNNEFLCMRRLKSPSKLSWKSFKKGMLVCHQSFFAKREIAGFYDIGYRYSADFDWCVRVLKKSAHIHNTNIVITNYLSEGVTTNNRWKSLKERFKIMCNHYGFLSTLFYHIYFFVRLPFQKIFPRT